MADLILREAALNAIDCWHIDFNSIDGAKVQSECWKTIKEMPSVDAALVVHGRWAKMTGMMPPEYHGHYECSECGWHMKGLRNSWTREEEMTYCPNCGAKMKED